ncbi:MAG: DUF1847 domain-containing protein [Deltaproteobacteria bacterium]|nr:DUF1847 domain-containing protein [Deltaproteobacteria bacterium]MBW2176898.1 DUF1847 domain-containing protein [Deltaproteobacteria bacterium]MBW2612679.1 DUF1847 domain-containing protein [Deltaproteobacteria bacterium]MBW2677569.1 DUF1847 domain-containing protein [Deltaproteobacteria bacterium]
MDEPVGKQRAAHTPSCASCSNEISKKICYSSSGIAAKGCPTVTVDSILKTANREYEKPDVGNFALQASRQEADCYANRDERPYVMQPTKTRIVEIYEFAQKMGYQRLGLAFCVGLAAEAAVVNDILKGHGFDVVSILCKAGRTAKETIGITDDDKINQGMEEAMCNPIFQARLLNHEKTEFNILMGLCVGHDSLFFKYADAPTTVLAVKDRVTGHNPLAAIYTSSSYYRKIKHRS